MRNQYAGNCVRCGGRVEAGAGHAERKIKGTPGWAVRCHACVGRGHAKPESAAPKETPNAG